MFQPGQLRAMVVSGTLQNNINQNGHLLEVVHLVKHFPVKSGMFSTRNLIAVDDVNFDLEKGKSIGLVGESGSGKSTVARLIMRLIEPTDGQVRFLGQNIVDMDKEGVRKARQEMAMVFQDPSSALDPKMITRELIGEPLKLRHIGRDEILEEVKKSLQLVNLPQSYMNRQHHQLSGGEKQRVGIARAIITHPKLVIADEPTSALDVSIQAQILELMKDLVKKLEVSLLFISHDLAVVKHVTDRVAVMYMGRILEIGPTRDVLTNPLHPYTQLLYSSVPEPDLTAKEKPVVIEPATSLIGEISGCKFGPRCPKAKKECAIESPKLVEVRPGHFVACDAASG